MIGKDSTETALFLEIGAHAFLVPEIGFFTLVQRRSVRMAISDSLRKLLFSQNKSLK